MTKEQRHYLALLNANKHNDGGIYGAYKKPSERKVSAYQSIARECLALGGYGLCVLNAGCQFFTAGYFYPDPITRETRARIELPTRTLDFAVVE